MKSISILYWTTTSDYHRAASYPRTQFTAVVNIYNGPGDGALPNAEYSHAIGTLNRFNNVRTVGYVSTTWCERELSTVLDDIAAYSFWGDYHDDLAMDGIFVDETPTQFSANSISYLQTIAKAVHESDGLRKSFIGVWSFHFGIIGVRSPRKYPPHKSLLQDCLHISGNVVSNATRTKAGFL